MKVALVHDWLVAQRGGEQVLLEIARLFPEAPVYTLAHQPGSVHRDIESHPIHTSFIQRLPGAPGRFRAYLPFFPMAIERFDLSDYELVLSTSHCVAKGVRTKPAQHHLCYVHTPMRYLWDQRSHYLPRYLPAPLVDVLCAPLRRWDVRSARRPDRIIANSRYVANRIERVWQRSAEVVYPPIDVDYFGEPGPSLARQGFLVVSALVPYKRVDIAVRAATQASIELTVIGEGGELERLRRLAGPTVTLRGGVADRAEIREAYRRACALLFCGEEDFGIVPIEAMAAGCPVIALASGGVVESVVDDGADSTGVFFADQSESSLLDAIARFETRLGARQFTAEALLRRAQRFSSSVFLARMHDLLQDCGLPG